MVRRQPVTLLEILIVIVLVGMTCTLIGVNAPKAFRGERFERGVDVIASKLRLAQEIMLDHRSDVEVRFTPEEGGLRCELIVAKPLPEEVSDALNRRAFVKGVTGCSETALFYEGSLGVTPKMTLKLFGKDRETKLALKGFPSAIKRGEEEVEIAQASYPEAALYAL